MLVRYLALLCLLGFVARPSWAQPYISTAETVPFACPTLCSGGSLTIKVFQIQRLPTGAEVQGEFSDVNGNFGTGSTILSVSQYSTNGGSNYQAGPYTFHGDVSDIFLRFVLPASMATGTGYKLRIRSSSGYVAADNFRCPGNGSISIASGGAALPPVPQTAEGAGKWIGHIYTWSPTTATPLTTDPLVAQQNFFNPSNYQGHALYRPLSLDLSFSTTGGVPGASADSSSFACAGNSFQTNFSMRLRRRETFAPGFYSFSIAGDDGIRFSLDGGATWLLSSWYDQLYSASQKTTNTAFPNGICLSGPVDLVIEYFQHPADARLTFTATRISPTLIQPVAQRICEGAGPVTFSYGYTATGNLYQWQASTDGGLTFTNLSETAPYSGTQTQTLTVNSPSASLNGVIYRCLLNNSCLTDQASDTASLTVRSDASLVTQPQDQSTCAGVPVNFSVQAAGQPTYQWQVDKGTGFANATDPAFTGAQTAQLSVNALAEMNGWLFRCIITTTCGTAESHAARLSLLTQPQIDRQPADKEICGTAAVQFAVGSPIVGAQYAWQVSTDGGSNWTSLTNEAPYTGTTDSVLTIASFPTGGDAFLYRALVHAQCGTDVASAPARLTACCLIPEFTNLITANNDGKNDRFASIPCNLTSFSMQIYDRWGGKVYTSSQASQGWDGGDQPAGIYYYHVSYTQNGDAVEKRGYIEVVRH